MSQDSIRHWLLCSVGIFPSEAGTKRGSQLWVSEIRCEMNIGYCVLLEAKGSSSKMGCRGN